ncbi:hypothetical protein U1Q18_047208 [Sarracenia purpurea var. burkii]
MASLEAHLWSLKGICQAKIRAFPAGSPVSTVAGANLNGDPNSQGEEAYTEYDVPEDVSPHLGPAFASVKDGVSSINGEEIEIQLEIFPRGDVRSNAMVPIAPKSEPEVSFIKEAEVAVDDEVGSVVSYESDGAICSGDSDDAEDEAEPNSNCNGVSITEVKIGEVINNQVISELNGDYGGAVALEEFEDLGVKVKQARETTIGLCCAHQVFEFLPNSPPGVNPEAGKVKTVAPINKLENEEEDGCEEKSEGPDKEDDDSLVKEEDGTVGALSLPLQVCSGIIFLDFESSFASKNAVNLGVGNEIGERPLGKVFSMVSECGVFVGAHKVLDVMPRQGRENIPHNVVLNTGSGAEMEGQNVVKGYCKGLMLNRKWADVVSGAQTNGSATKDTSHSQGPASERASSGMELEPFDSSVSGGRIPRQGFQSAAQPTGGRDPPRLDDQEKRQKKSTATIEDKADSGVEAVQAVTEADVEENEEVKNTGSLLASEDLEMADSKKGPSLAESDSKDGFEKMIRSEPEEDESVSSVGENGVTPTVRVSEVGEVQILLTKEEPKVQSASPSDKGVKPSWANIVEGRGGTNADKKTEEALGVEGMGLDFVGLNGKGDVIEAKEKGGSRDLGSGSFHPEESERGFSPVEDYKVEFIQFITALLFWLGTWISATDFGPATSASYFRERIWFWFVMHIFFLLLRGLLGNVLRILWALANAAEGKG